jgi:hypothetical protein
MLHNLYVQTVIDKEDIREHICEFEMAVMSGRGQNENFSKKSSKMQILC